MFPPVPLPPPLAEVLPAGLPLRVRLVAAAAVAGLAWWRFGRGERRRPAAAWAAAFAAAGLAVGGDGASAVLLRRGALPWVPTCLVGAGLAVVVARGRWRGRLVAGRRRRRLAVAAAVLLAGPPLTLAAEWNPLRSRVLEAMYAVLPWRDEEFYWSLVADPVRSLAVAAVCGCLAAAAWRGPREGDGPEAAAGSGKPS